MRKAILGKRVDRSPRYRYRIPSEEPNSTLGWTPQEKLLHIALRQTANELGTTVFELSDNELAARMDRVLATAAATLSTL